MAGTGFNYIREIMRMNLPEESTPKPLREYEREEKAKKFHYIGRTPYEPFDNNCTVKLMPAGMAGVISVHKSELRPYNAEVNDVVQFCGRLLVFTERKHWVQFVPGPCTNYDGPNPYEKTVYISTATEYDIPIAEAIRENLKKSLEANGAIGFYELERVSDTEIVAKYDIKYLGETETDVKRAPNKRAVWLEHPFRTYNRVRHVANIGEMVEYDGLRYVWNGNQWVEMPKTDKVALGWPTTKKEENNMAVNIRYLGEAQSAMRDGYKCGSVMIDGKWVDAQNTDLVTSDNTLYCYVKAENTWKKISKISFTEKAQYHKIPYGFMAIKKVHFSGDKTIVMWADGTKTMVSCGENEVFDPEKGLAMAIAKKAFGNQGNYYNQIKKWLPKDYVKLDEILTSNPTQEYMDAVRDLITDMALNGATKAELVRAIRFSKELIDGFKATPSEKPDFNPFKLEKDYGIAALREKYQKPKKTK